MTRTIWLCLQCGWRRPFEPHYYQGARNHRPSCRGYFAARTIDEHGRITGGARSRQP